jgi:type I restriction enzyme S subunit
MANNWRDVAVSEIATVIRGASPRPKGDARYYGGQIPRLMVADVTRDGRYVTPRIDFLTEEGAKLSRPVPKGTLTIVCSGDVGTPSLLAVDACIHDGFLALRNISSECDSEYLYETFVSIKFLLERSATHGGVFINLTTEILRDFIIALPPLAEQRKIAEILRTWDEAIEKLEALRAAKEKLTSAIADDLIFGVRRIAGYQEPWPSRRLAEVTRELTRRNRDGAIGRDLVMGVTNSRGIVPMREQTIAADISRYLILPPRAFAYNPMRINVGSIAMSQFERDVLVSPDYVLFECLPGKLDPDFLDHLRQSHFWSHYINAGGTGSVRMRTYYDDLAALRLKMPPYEEQLAISEVLNTAKNEMQLIADQIDALTCQKRGLMQKLLTGEWRVNPNESKAVI